jgi:hypothetical protein
MLGEAGRSHCLILGVDVDGKELDNLNSYDEF